jgi:hypothetical protein
MRITSNQCKLLQLILDEIQEHVIYDNEILRNSCRCILENQAPEVISNDTVLLCSLAYLQELKEEAGLASLQYIWEYLQERRRLALEFAKDMMDQVDREPKLSGNS